MTVREKILHISVTAIIFAVCATPFVFLFPTDLMKGISVGYFLSSWVTIAIDVVRDKL